MSQFSSARPSQRRAGRSCAQMTTGCSSGGEFTRVGAEPELVERGFTNG